MENNGENYEKRIMQAIKQEKTFDPKERENHRKKQRVTNSLGALLAGIGGGGSSNSQSTEPRSTSDAGSYDKPVNTNNQSTNKFEYKQEQSNNKNNFGGMSSNYQSAKNEFGWSAAGFDMSEPSFGQGDSSNNEEPQAFKDSSAAHKSSTDISNMEFDSWGDVKRLDDDHDNDYIAYETKKLAEQYGEGIISIKYTDQGTLGYNCQLCFAVMNAKQPLEMHCSGMKHLKKKDIFDKSKAAGTVPLIEQTKLQNPPPRKGSSHDRGREHDRGRPRSPRNYRRSPSARSRSPQGYEKTPYRRDLGHDRGAYGRGREADSYSGYDYRGYSDGRRDDWGYPEDTREDRYRPDMRSRYGDHRDAPPHPSDRRYHDDPYDRRLPDDPYNRRLPDDRYDRLSSGIRDRPHSSTSLPRNHGSRSPLTSERTRFNEDRMARMPSPPPAKPPPPVISAPEAPESTNLAGGPAAALLLKLAQCTVKNEGDAELAANVIELMLKSLKQYNAKIGEKSVADLMEQAEIKLATAKAIRAIKPAPASVPDPISIAMETLRRAAAEQRTDMASSALSSSLLKYF